MPRASHRHSDNFKYSRPSPSADETCTDGLLDIKSQPSVSVEYQAHVTHDNTSRVLGRQLADARKRACLTQIELAERTGVDQAVISRIERGKANPTVSMLVTLSRPLNLQLSFIPYMSSNHEDLP